MAHYTSPFEKLYNQTRIQGEYLSAKIIANPFNYKISDRLIFTDSLSKYSMSSKNIDAELDIGNFLELEATTWSKNLLNKRNLYVDFDKASKTTCVNGTFSDAKWLNTGTLKHYNHLMVNDHKLMHKFCYLNPVDILSPFKNDLYKTVFDKQYLKAYVNIYLRCIKEDSLIPYMFFINTKYSDNDLKYLINMTYIQEAIDAKQNPVFIGSGFSSTIPSRFLETVDIPMYSKSVKNANVCFATSDKSLIGRTYADFELEYQDLKFKLGLIYVLAYGCEILYQYNLITDPVLKERLSTLFTLGYVKDSFIKHLYTVNDTLDVIINSDLEDCFVSNNEIRFIRFKEYIETVLSKDIYLNRFNVKICSDLKYFGIPLMFADIVTNCHEYAMQKLRVSSISITYTYAKSKGFGKFYHEEDEDNLISELTTSLRDLMGTRTEEDDDDDALMDISSGSKTKAGPNEDDFKVTDDTDKPILESLENLKSSLDKSKYSFRINNCTEIKDGYEEAYKKIADDVFMVSHNLTKQIREIKTYNTGGKQPGASKGKLDRKNICHYKTSHNIFYNNDYKVKEMDLAFGIVLDMSGSMHGTGIKNGTIVMILLHEVLNSLGINHSIIGHDSDDTHQSNIYKYYQFKEEKTHSLQRPYNLMGITAKYGNCDSGALYYMQQLMHTVRNKDKICLIFSDGAPTECTGAELRNQVAAMEKEGIHVIGIGINFDSIKKYYKDYANGKNLKEMLDIVVNILTRYVLEKKD